MKVKVVNVIDGDTIKVSSGEQRFKVNLTGVETARLVTGEREYGYFVKDWLTGRLQQSDQVSLELEEGSRPDSKGPRSAFVFVDNNDLTKIMIRKGLAFVDKRWAKRTEDYGLNSLQETAIDSRRGLWGRWEDMGFELDVRKVRRINRVAIANSGGEDVVDPKTPSVEPVAESTVDATIDNITGAQLSFFEPSFGSTALSDDIKNYINSYNNTIKQYNEESDCFWIGAARGWAEFALNAGYDDLAIAFNKANASTDCGVSDLLI